MTGLARSGRLLLVPNTLDLGAEPVPIEQVLAVEPLDAAARLRHWVVEDARQARAFIKRIAACRPLACALQEMQIVELPRPSKARPGVQVQDWARLLRPAVEGHDLGLLSDAGLPGLADPGAALVATAHRTGIDVLPLVGASSIALALAASGLNGQNFAFVGYVPAAATERGERLRELESLSRRLDQTQLFIETPYRNRALAETALVVLQETTQLAIASGLTLPGGWCRTLPIGQWRRSPPALSERVPAVFALLA